MRVYLDNAATTPIDPVVLEAMLPYMRDHFGNPSSIHSHGREVRAAIEKARKTVATLLNTSPSEIFFTSGGTEADNTALRCSVEAYGITHAITSPIEHHAVLHTMQELAKTANIKLSIVKIDNKGNIDMDDLESLLKNNPKSLISLMHANNEIGTLNDIQAISDLAKKYGAIFHTDTVQTMGHYVHDLQKLNVNFLVGSAHKFHGPKGTGFLYLNADTKIHPFIHGGAQERNMRGGTENVYGVIGLAKALEIAYTEMSAHQKHIESLKTRMIEGLKSRIEGIQFNGESANLQKSLYTVLNVSFPAHEINEMLLFNLDIHKISASGGSACSSGSNVGSHVLNSLNIAPERGNVRFSFSKYNTTEEIDFVLEKVASMYNNVTV